MRLFRFRSWESRRSLFSKGGSFRGGRIIGGHAKRRGVRDGFDPTANLIESAFLKRTPQAPRGDASVLVEDEIDRDAMLFGLPCFSSGRPSDVRFRKEPVRVGIQQVHLEDRRDRPFGRDGQKTFFHENAGVIILRPLPLHFVTIDFVQFVEIDLRQMDDRLKRRIREPQVRYLGS